MSEEALEKAWSNHSILWKENVWVYPVISRRAGGISIGINLNPDKHCTFDCAYCQVDRSVPGLSLKNDVIEIEKELDKIISAYEKNGLADFVSFQNVEAEKRMIKDICISGDGESTMSPIFPQVCAMMRRKQDELSQYPLQLTLITNATLLDRENVRKGLKILTEKRGEIWAKIDAGTENWYKKIDRSRIPLEKVEQNIEGAIRDFPLRIQTMLCQVQGEFPSDEEIQFYIQRLQKIYAICPQNFLGVQLYGVVRHTAIPDVLPLKKEFFQNVAEKIHAVLPVSVQIF